MDDTGTDNNSDLLDAAYKTRTFYGRLKGKSLGQLQAHRLEHLLPQYAVDLSSMSRNVWMEIGFGGGEHLVQLAANNPTQQIIGCEPFQNGVVKCLAMLEEKSLDNLHIHAGDARDLLDIMPDSVLSRVYLLYPDPWHKRRHQKRRFIGKENLDVLDRVMKNGAELRLATDIDHYVKTSVQNIEAHPNFQIKHPTSRDPWQDWYRTRYEAKALREGRAPSYTIFENKACEQE